MYRAVESQQNRLKTGETGFEMRTNYRVQWRKTTCSVLETPIPRAAEWPAKTNSAVGFAASCSHSNFGSYMEKRRWVLRPFIGHSALSAVGFKPHACHTLSGLAS